MDYCSPKCQRECWSAGHKVLCSKVPKAVEEAKARIVSFSLDQYTTENIGTFMVTEAEAERGRIVKEMEAQEMCYDAWDMPKGSVEKLKKILATLKHFPLSVEGWGNVAHFYHWETKSHKIKSKECATEALKMYDIAIECARILNSTWTDSRAEELSWGEIDNRPYLRAIFGRAHTLKDSGNVEEAVKQAKKLLRWNPDDNQGVRQILCTWYLEINDTEGCTNLLRKYTTDHDTSLSYADVLLQFLRWKKDDVVEKDVQLALYKALQSNAFVPDLLLAEKTKKVNHGSISPGGRDEAESFAQKVRPLWKAYPECLVWLKAQKCVSAQGKKVPKETDLIHLLKSGIKLAVSCVHTNLEGGNKMDSVMMCTQKRGMCLGSGRADFTWPRQLNRAHQKSSDILLHDNDWDNRGWRKTTYNQVLEVPFWSILLAFQAEMGEGESSSENEDEEIDQDVLKETISKMKQNTLCSSVSTKCKHCDSTPTMCALDDKGCHFYCCKSCMDKDFDEDSDSDPMYFELNSDILRICPSEDSLLRKLDIDLVLSMATKYMPNVIALDIFIPQTYVLTDGWYNGDNERSLTLSSAALLEFLYNKHSKLQVFSLRLDECCDEHIAKMTDAGKALLPLGNMPNLAKFELSNFKFVDINILTSCMNPNLKVLNINHIRLRSSTWCIPDCEALVRKISEMKNIVTLGLADNALTDEDLDHMLQKLNNLRCLDVRGKFGGENSFEPRHSLLTDRGLEFIAKHCSRLQSLDVSYQPRASSVGIKAIMNNCPHLLELEAADVKIPTRDIEEILMTSKELLHLNISTVCDHECYLIEDVVKATGGRTIISGSNNGVYEVNLSPKKERIRKTSMKRIESAWENRTEPHVYNRWEPI